MKVSVLAGFTLSFVLVSHASAQVVSRASAPIAPLASTQGVSHFCATGANGSRLEATGSARLSADGGVGDLVLHASNVPAGTPGLFLSSTALTAAIPFGQGFRCVAAPIVRSPVVTNATYAPDYTSPPFASLVPGATRAFQFWFRSGTSFDLSDGVEITFGPAELVTDVVTLAQGTNSNHPTAWAGGLEVAEDAASWDALWSQHVGASFPQLPAPPVDFGAYMVIAVFGGTVSHGGVDLAVRSVGVSVTTLELRTLTTYPGANCFVTWALTQPFAMVRVPRLPNRTAIDWIAGGLAIDCP